ncbi:MAG: protein kinase [Deltaproteobacteria bacterium]|nr:protein kinase [Deltaproteobacteria bacterium]
MIGEQIGNFKIVSRLGQGGMGEVYLGEHEKIGTRVAIKMLLPHISLNKEHVERFFNEAIAVGKIQHSGIVKIFDVGFHATGRAYLVMEFLPGESLNGRISRLGKLPLAMVSEIGRQICSVLEAVHKAGITHRDLKPDNIFIVPDDELASGERVKVLDFGIAKLSGAGGGMTATSAGSMGTPAYMSPEQWKNSKNVDWRADAYSLGCLAFEMAAGRPPFIAETIGEACAKHLSEEPPPLASIVAVPRALDELVMQLLQKSPDARPSSIRDIATRFASLVGAAAPIGTAATQMSGAAFAVPSESSHGSMNVTAGPRIARATPTPPPMVPITTLGGSAGSSQVAKPGSKKALMFGLAGLAVVLAAVVIVLAMKAGGSERAAVARTGSNVEPGSATPPPTVTTTPIETTKPEPASGSSDAPASRGSSDASANRGSSGVPANRGSSDAPAKTGDIAAPKVGSASVGSASNVASGFLSVSSTPGATVFVNGKKVGVTPFVKLAFPPGTYTLVAKAESGASQTQVVTITSDQTTVKRLSFPATAEQPKAENEPVAAVCLDEVGCIVQGSDAPACCAKYKKGTPKLETGPKPSSDLPESLDRAMISQAVAGVKSRVTSCGDKSPAKGSVKVSVKVTPDGSVENVTVKTTPDPALGACVAAAVKRARFPRTQSGGTFGYPFVF